MSSLPTARLADTDVEVTTLGLGTAPLGGLFTPVSDEDAAENLADLVAKPSIK